MIRLGQLLKLAGRRRHRRRARRRCSPTTDVLVNGELEDRRGRQLHHGDVVTVVRRCVSPPSDDVPVPSARVHPPAGGVASGEQRGNRVRWRLTLSPRLPIANAWPHVNRSPIVIGRFEDLITPAACASLLAEDANIELRRRGRRARRARRSARPSTSPEVAIVNFGSLRTPVEVNRLHTRPTPARGCSSSPAARRRRSATRCSPSARPPACRRRPRPATSSPPSISRHAASTCCPRNGDRASSRSGPSSSPRARPTCSSTCSRAARTPRSRSRCRVCVETVRTHRRNIYRKLGVRTRRELAALHLGVTERELALRRTIFEAFAATGAPPPVDDVATLRSLAERHVVVLDERDRIVMAHPFAAHDDGARVEADGRVVARQLRVGRVRHRRSARPATTRSSTDASGLGVDVPRRPPRRRRALPRRRAGRRVVGRHRLHLSDHAALPVGGDRRLVAQHDRSRGGVVDESRSCTQLAAALVRRPPGPRLAPARQSAQSQAILETVGLTGPFWRLPLGTRNRAPLSGPGRAQAATRWATSSAICTVLSAAPLSRLSPTTKKFSACGSVRSRRTRPTTVSLRPAHSSGVGASSTTRFGKASSASSASVEVDLLVERRAHGDRSGRRRPARARRSASPRGPGCSGSCATRSGASSPRRCSRCRPACRGAARR